MQEKLGSVPFNAILNFDCSSADPEALRGMIEEYLYPAFMANKGVISYLSPEMLHGLGLMREEQQLKKEQGVVEQCLGYLTEAYSQTETATDSAAPAVPDYLLAHVMLSGVVLEDTMLRGRILAAKLDEAFNSLFNHGDLEKNLAEKPS